MSLADSSRPLPGPKRRVAGAHWLALFLTIALPIAALCPVCRNGFVTWDDNKTIYHNPRLDPATLHSLVIWWTTVKMELYVPVTYTVWGLISLIARVAPTADTPAYLSPIPFHTASLLLHVLACCVVFRLLRMLIGQTWPAAAGAILFGVHPVQVEAVAWASGLKDVLGGLLALSAIWQYLVAVQKKRDARTGPVGWGWNYGFAIILFILAMLAKPNEMVTPLLAGILDFFFFGRSWRRALRWLWPWLILTFLCGIASKLAQPVIGRPHNVALYLRPLVALASIAFYIGKLLWPSHLALDYGLRPPLVVQSPWLLADLLLIVSTAVVLWLARRKAMPVIAGAIFFVAALLPVMGFVEFDFQWYSNVADHYLYLAMFGAAMAASWVAARWSGLLMVIAAAAVLTALAVTSHFQTGVWKDTRTLFSHTLEVNPQCSVAYTTLALLDIQNGNPTRGLQLAREALQVRPDDPVGYIQSGLALWHLGRRPEAVRAYSHALELAPWSEAAIEGLAGVLSELGDLPRAERLQRHVVEKNPTSADQHYKLGWILAHENKLPEAIDELQTADRLDPTDTDARALLVYIQADATQRSP